MAQETSLSVFWLSQDQFLACYGNVKYEDFITLNTPICKAEKRLGDEEIHHFLVLPIFRSLRASLRVLLRQGSVDLRATGRWVKFPQSGCDLNAGSHRFEFISIDYYDVDAAKVFVFENRRVRFEPYRNKSHARNVAFI
jgi:hypothetical protein